MQINPQKMNPNYPPNPMQIWHWSVYTLLFFLSPCFHQLFARFAWHWLYFAALLDLHASSSFSLDSTHTFLLKTWLESCKSAINTQQANTERNWRNRGINHKIKPIYPQEWILNTYLILCKYDSDQTPPCLNFCLSSSKTLDTSN